VAGVARTDRIRTVKTMIEIDFQALVASLSMPGVIAIYGSASLVAAVLAPVFAAMKGRHVGYWTVAAFALPILVLVLPFLRRLTLEERRLQAERIENERAIPLDML
jgi:hypothetical protein